jgi:hypothetical protein
MNVTMASELTDQFETHRYLAIIARESGRGRAQTDVALCRSRPTEHGHGR